MIKTAVFLKAGAVIGTGHLMRVSALLKNLGPDFAPMLYTDELHESLTPLCAVFTKIKHAPKEELAALALADKPDLAIFDHYALDSSTERPLFEHCPVVVIDDLANRSHCCQLLFDQGIERKAEHYLVPGLVNPECKVLCGSQYAMLNPALAAIERTASDFALRTPVKGQSAASPRVLICYGGADPVHGCLKSLSAVLRDKLYQDYAFTLVAGAGSSAYDKLKTMIAEHKLQEEIALLRHCSDMPALYAAHQLSAGAYGVMFSERMCAGLPSVCTQIADNQAGADQLLKQHELGVDLPLDQLDKPGCLKAALQQAEQNGWRFCQNGRRHYDGQGLCRQAKAIKALLG